MDVFASDLLTGVLEVVQDSPGKVEKVGGNLSTLVRCKAVAALPNDGADKADEPRHGDLCGVGREGARRPARLRKSASCVCFLDGRVDGVFSFETTLDGRQYCDLLSPLWPHGLPVALSIHFSRAHRRRLLPFSPLRTSPRDFLHFATACEARADGHTEYSDLTFFVQ